MANPFEIFIGKEHEAVQGKTPVATASVNKIAEALDGMAWAVEHQQFSDPRYVGDPDPDWKTYSSGQDRSGFDFTHGYLKAIAGRDFFLVDQSDLDYTDQFREACKTNRPDNAGPGGDIGNRTRSIYGNLHGEVSNNSVIGKAINSGLVIDGVKFTDVGDTFSRLDVRGLYSTNATVSVVGGTYTTITIPGANFYNEYVNPGDFVFLPNDVTNRFMRVVLIFSADTLWCDLAAGTTGTGQTAHVLRGPITFRRCRFDNTVWVNNTIGLTFDQCEFVYDENNSLYGGIFACGTSFPADDPGAFFGLKIQNCKFFQRHQAIAAKPGPVGTFQAMVNLDNGWGHLCWGNLWIRTTVAGQTGLGVFVANGLGNGTKTGEGGIFANNHEIYASTTYNVTQRRVQLAGAFYLYASRNVWNGALL